MRIRAVPLLVGLLAVGGLLVSLLAVRAAPALSDAVAAHSNTRLPRIQRASEPPTRPAPPTHRLGADPTGAVATATPTVPAAVGSLPATIRIAAVGLRAPIRPVGVAGNGQMELPADPDIVGWYRHGPHPGAGRGASVLASHVDTVKNGLGVFALLTEARRGDIVVVTTSAGRRLAYHVSAVDRYDKQALPPRLFTRSGTEKLHLITCGGEYDAGRGGYEDNLVVTALPH